MERRFFEQVQDVIEGLVFDVDGTLHTKAHGRGVKIWFGDATREHYEAQLIRLDGKVVLEVGFHAEHPNVDENQAVLDQLLVAEAGVDVSAPNPSRASSSASTGGSGSRRRGTNLILMTSRSRSRSLPVSLTTSRHSSTYGEIAEVDSSRPVANCRG
jgi:hypothetical protein